MRCICTFSQRSGSQELVAIALADTILVQRSLVRIMISVAYGVDIRTSETGVGWAPEFEVMLCGQLTPSVQWPEKLSTFNNEVLATMTPGKYLVELIPACELLYQDPLV